MTITDEDGNETEYPVDTATGTALAEDVEPGEYTVTAPGIGDYTAPEPQTVTVKEKVVYKADVAAVKDKIVQANEVVESQEDSGYGTGGGAPIAEEVTDTVSYAESSAEETGAEVYYTAQVSEDGYPAAQRRHKDPLPPRSMRKHRPHHRRGARYRVWRRGRARQPGRRAAGAPGRKPHRAGGGRRPRRAAHAGKASPRC